MTAGSPPRSNAADTVRVRLTATVSPAQANAVSDRSGTRRVRPGQGGVVLGHRIGGPAGRWASDHLEPGASLGHSDPAAYAALQALCCVGNLVVVRSGAAAGAEGFVYGKHGGVLATFAEPDLERLVPGDQVAVEANGSGLSLVDFPDVAVHSCSPSLLTTLLPEVTSDGKMRVEVAAVLPPTVAAAGIGMPANGYNLDLDPAAGEQVHDLDFGSIVLLEEHDHRFGRQRRHGWLAVGAVVHGSSLGGGHGLGMITLLSGPVERFVVSVVPGTNLTGLMADGVRL
ncbi:MAG: hypothetical protein QOE54_5144 [Streptosporangiaceae bacterium]|jgi:hypothetical protein|nr:hypothetical protein [Streptosporangiaceae bacterium]